MKIGFLTACFPRVPLSELVPWAASEGFKTLELAAWPNRARRDFMARHIDAATLTQRDAYQVLELFDEHQMSISAMAYYDNNLHPDRKRREEHLGHLHKVIDAAQMLGVKLVGTFVGARPVKPDLVMREVGEIFRGVVSYAEDRGIRVMIENCPMDNWVKFGLPGNYAYSPELWERLFNEVPSENFGLNFDPSHLYWLGIDHLRATRDFASRIFHAHAKDAEMLRAGRYQYGVLGEQLGGDPWRSGWWRYRMPGKGEIEWGAFIDVLREIGYDDVLSIEHEDPEYGGTEDLTKEGLRLGREHLAALI
jgi:sugar phosphate isomerase/epimerase